MIAEDIKFAEEILSSRIKNIDDLIKSNFNSWYTGITKLHNSENLYWKNNFHELKDHLIRIYNENESNFKLFSDEDIEKIKSKFDSEEAIWKWCLLNASLQFHFIDTDELNKFGYRIRNTNSRTINDLLINFPDPEDLKRKIKSMDINMKKERIEIIDKINDFPSIRNEVFTEDPLFKKGFLAIMFYNAIMGTNYQSGPCIDYHMINLFREISGSQNDIFINRFQMFYLIVSLKEELNTTYDEIDRRLFGYSKKLLGFK